MFLTSTVLHNNREFFSTFFFCPIMNWVECDGVAGRYEGWWWYSQLKNILGKTTQREYRVMDELLTGCELKSATDIS